MTEERLITAATVTSGEKTDGKELPELVRKSREAVTEGKNPDIQMCSKQI